MTYTVRCTEDYGDCGLVMDIGECYFHDGRAYCAKCGSNVTARLTAPPRIETRVDMAAVERCERMVRA